MFVNLALIIEEHDADRVALIADDQTISYGELRARTAAVRARLAAAGLGANDRVLVACGNEPEFAIAALATLGVGGIAIPVNPRSPLPELLANIDLVHPAAVLVGPSMRRLLDDPEVIDAPLIDLGELADDGNEPPAIVERADEDLAFLMLTSGVTGASKAAMLSHGNLAFVQQLTCDGGPDSLAADDVVLGVLPFAHIFGLNVSLLSTLRAGATCVLLTRFDADESLELIQRHRITRIAAVPPMWKRWADLDAPNDSFALVTYAASGAAALTREVWDSVYERYGLEIAEGYGLTETSPVVTNHRGIPIKRGSVGKLVDGVDLIIVDDDGTPVDDGDTGEIVVRGPLVFQGYLDAPEITANVLTPDGWFWTGDVGVFDDDGYLYLVDRIKDLIIVSGFNVYPAEVESILGQHPKVAGAVVVGRPDNNTGEAVTAYVTGQVSESELNDFARSKVAGYKAPTEYHFVDELPVAASGKVVRKNLRT